MRRVFLCYTEIVSLSRSIIIFDGSNFYHKLKEINLPRVSSFDFNRFSKFISDRTVLTSKFYCVGKISASQNDAKARTMMAKQQSLVTRLIKQEFTIQYGYLLKTDSKFHEKGVDVQIATDILKGAYKNLYKTVFLVSSDSDLIPAIAEAEETGKTVVYVGFKHKPSFALLRACKKHFLLTEQELLKFVK
ncbi:MAG: hypothetical protein UT63_C0053G0008 [Candidatus Gottesmanbacteria bacterium GW2011_GWC2_39_8]|uniref:NYN domain-containing protein n=1 Tax=Candidatus Gottesmanbacteria bacterium GW2011_GWC2_39_8 TaxID=1618450 RepID=A0A0G0T2I8_9BACT|nr:MAG: hypothetical protein UT63_C0053G0008 [Candidatus Gottesmanbacteria bacterium GW2011_GWC2_39_8]